MALIDANGVCHMPAEVPARIACLVPSITELLFALELDDQLVARTQYCIHPADRIKAVPNVGGTKKVKHRLLRRLNPTHVILNIDENTQPLAEQLADYVPHIIVTHPNKPLDNLDLYRLFGGIFHRITEAKQLCWQFERALRELWQTTHDWPKRKVLYLIWSKPWMSVARGTYIANTLSLVNWETLPPVTAPRYPTLEITPALLETVDWVLFSTEPYSFKPLDLHAFADLFGCPGDKLALIDGEMTSWYGNRAIQGLAYLRHFAEQLEASEGNPHRSSR